MINYKKYLWSPLLHPRPKEYLVIIMISFVVTFLSFGPKIFAPFVGQVDYKVIEKIKKKEIDNFSLIERIEDQLKKTLRFNFIAEHLENFELKSFQKNPIPYHIVRLLIYCYAFIILWLLFSKYSSPFIAFPITLVFLGNNYWFEIIAQIETTVIYKVIGIPLYLLAFSKLFYIDKDNLSNKLKWTVILFTSGAIAQGCEEMFFIFLIPIIALLYNQFKKNPQHGAIIFSILFPLLIWGGIGFYAIYNNPTSDESKWYGVFHNNKNFRLFYFRYLTYKFSWFKLTSIVFFTLSLLSKIRKITDKYNDFFNDYTYHIYKVIGFCYFYFEFISISFQSFYFGMWPNGDSRDFPGQLIAPAGIVCIYILLIKLRDQFKNNELTEMSKQIKLYMTIGLFVYSFGQYFKKAGLFGFLRESIRETRESINLNNNIQNYSKMLIENPNAPLAIWVQNNKDIDYAEGLAYYFRENKVENPIFIEIVDELKEGSKDIPVNVDKIETIYDARIMGYLGYTAWSKIPDTKSCFAVGISAPSQDLHCKNIGKLLE